MSKWGSEQEQYTYVCMKLLLARYCYYVLANQIMTDAEYDQLEDGLKAFEAAAPHMIHPKSPTKVPGSDRAEDYPRSVRRYADQHIINRKQEEVEV